MSNGKASFDVVKAVLEYSLRIPFVISYVIGDRLFLVDTCYHLMIYLDYFKMINLLMHERVSNFWHILFPTLPVRFDEPPSHHQLALFYFLGLH